MIFVSFKIDISLINAMLIKHVHNRKQIIYMCHVTILGSSDLIRRKSTEAPKREKPLSLTERLKKEFGFEDSEDESGKEGKGHSLSCSFLGVCVCVWNSFCITLMNAQ